MLTGPSDFELFDESGYNVGTSPGGLIPIVILVNSPPTKKPPKVGHRLREVIAQITTNPEAAAELKEARRWVANEIYTNEPDSLQALRLKLGLSQAELAKLANTTQARVSRIENGEELPRFDTMKRLTIALQIDMNTLSSAIEKAAMRKEHAALPA